VYPTNHAEHETVEITQGLSNWSEVGFYIFTSARSGDGWQWVGDHIRPRVRGARRAKGYSSAFKMLVQQRRIGWRWQGTISQ